MANPTVPDKGPWHPGNGPPERWSEPLTAEEDAQAREDLQERRERRAREDVE